MAGNSEGARKAAQTAKEKYGEHFHAKNAAMSWSDPTRNRRVGFALLDEQKRKELGAKGGRKTKEDYKETAIDTKTQEKRTGASQ